MEILVLELMGVVLMLLIALALLLRLVTEEIVQWISVIRRRNHWKKRYKKHRRR